jgi:hypothetical protein
MHKEVAMTLRRLVLWSLLGALLLAAGITLTAAAAPTDPAARYLEPAPWWWLGPKGDTYRAVIAGRPHGLIDGVILPPDIKPIDPVGTSPSRSSDARGDAAASKSSSSISGSLSAPGGASIANAAGSLTFSARASSAPARPDAREVRRELEAAHRALGL